MVGCLLIDNGLGYESAIARIAELRAGAGKAIDACPESPSQHRLLGSVRLPMIRPGPLGISVRLISPNSD